MVNYQGISYFFHDLFKYSLIGILVLIVLAMIIGIHIIFYTNGIYAIIVAIVGDIILLFWLLSQLFDFLEFSKHYEEEN